MYMMCCTQYFRKQSRVKGYNLKEIIEFRWHGRGGQGAWTASELLARTALKEGKYIQSFPEFGPERMGAPVAAFTRISDTPIRIHCAVYEPDVVIVLDPTLLKSVPVTSGLSETGTIIINSTATAHTCSVKHNRIQTHNGFDLERFCGFTDKFHHDRWTNGDYTVNLLTAF